MTPLFSVIYIGILFDGWQIKLPVYVGVVLCLLAVFEFGKIIS